VAFEYLAPTLDQVDVTNFEKGLYRAAGFLADHEERHAFISNHLAGCALALLETGNYFNEPGFISRAEELLSQIVEKQSPEGGTWNMRGRMPVTKHSVWITWHSSTASSHRFHF
jgi:hypothetical protein